ncbi:tyrosine-protein phosphatase [Actinocorallia lasiicapitis]
MRLAALTLPPVLIAGLVAAPASAHDDPPRIIKVEGALNVRDIGGYPAAQGKKVRYGLVFRAASLSKVSGTGKEQLKKLKLTQAIDFRSKSELGTDGADRLPSGVKSVPVRMPFGTIGGILTTISLNPAVTYMENEYRRLVDDPGQRAQLAKGLHLVVNAKKPILYHCTNGKDRTGALTAVVLTALGVQKKNVYKDYLRSNAELDAANKKLLDWFRSESIDPILIRPALYVQPSFLDAFFNQIKKKYGTFDRFLTKGLKINKKEKAKLRKHLLK